MCPHHSLLRQMAAQKQEKHSSKMKNTQHNYLPCFGE